jgi:hypothetical protein
MKKLTDRRWTPNDGNTSHGPLGKRAITPRRVIRFTSKDLDKLNISKLGTQINFKIYIPCNFEVNLSTQFGVIALFSSTFQNFNTFCPLFQKL